MRIFKSFTLLLLLGFSAISSANMGVAFVHGTGHQTDAYNDYWTGSFVNSVMSGNGSRYTVINCDFEQYMWTSGAAGCLAGQLSSFISAQGITSMNVITHSNGGNVMRWIMSNPTWDSRYPNIINKTNKVIALAPSSKGTPLADAVVAGNVFEQILGWILGYASDAVKQQQVSWMASYNADWLYGTSGRPALPKTFKSVVGSDVDCLCEPLSGCCEPTGLCQSPVCTDDPANPCDEPTNDPDGTSCGADLVCTGGVCGPIDPCSDADTRCNDGNECTSTDCDPVTGACINDPLDGASCTEFPNGYCALGGDCVSGTQIAENALFCDPPGILQVNVPLDVESSLSGPPIPGATLDMTNRVSQEDVVVSVPGLPGSTLMFATFEVTVTNGTPTSIALADPNVPRLLGATLDIDTGDVVTAVTVDGGAPSLFTTLTDAQIQAMGAGGIVTLQIGVGIDSCEILGGSSIFPTVP